MFRVPFFEFFFSFLASFCTICFLSRISFCFLQQLVIYFVIKNFSFKFLDWMVFVLLRSWFALIQWHCHWAANAQFDVRFYQGNTKLRKSKNAALVLPKFCLANYASFYYIILVHLKKSILRILNIFTTILYNFIQLVCNISSLLM